MSSSGTRHDPANVEGDLARGDRLARQGEWSAAVAHWRVALGGRHAPEASQRIRWFLDQTKKSSNGAVTSRGRRKASHALLAAAAAAVAGTTVTLLGMAEPELNGTMVAIVAWMCFFGSMALMIAFTLRLESPSDRARPLLVDDPTVAAAGDRASNIEREHAQQTC